MTTIRAMWHTARLAYYVAAIQCTGPLHPDAIWLCMQDSARRCVRRTRSHRRRNR